MSRNYMQTTCPRCGTVRLLHPFGGCPVSHAVSMAVIDFRNANGTRWKAKLRDAWNRGDSLGPELDEAKRLIGSKRLYKLGL